MMIKRVLNNNTIVCLDQKGEEIVVKGRGIAFAKKAGQEVDKSKIEKIFTLDNKETVRQYQEVIMNIPDDVINIAEEIIAMIKENTQKNINDKIYITLTDHITNLLERISMGISFDSSLLWNVQALYPEEYQLALKAVDMIKHQFDVKVPKDEANFIAIHIVNSEMEVEFQDTIGILETIDKIMSIIKKSFIEQSFNNEGLNYARFILHLRFLLQRIVRGGILQLDQNDHMVSLLIREYPNQAECVSKIMELITQKYYREIDGERLFLLIHVIRLTTLRG